MVDDWNMYFCFRSHYTKRFCSSSNGNILPVILSKYTLLAIPHNTAVINNIQDNAFVPSSCILYFSTFDVTQLSQNKLTRHGLDCSSPSWSGPSSIIKTVLIRAGQHWPDSGGQSRVGINSCAHSGRRLNGSNWGIRNFLRQDRLINLESKQFLLIRRLAAETVDLTSTHSMNFTPMMGIFQPSSVKFANVHQLLGEDGLKNGLNKCR